MHLISSYLPPAATSHAIKCQLGEELLVVARINRLDVYELLTDGARLINSLELLPRIVALHEIKPKSGSGALLVITDHPDCSALIVGYSKEDRALSVTSSQKLASPYGLPLAGCVSCAMALDGQRAAVALYQGIIHILSFSRKGEKVLISSKFECSIRELLLSSFCFVPYTIADHHALAFLHRTHTGQRRLTIRTIDENNSDISSEAVEIDIQDADVEALVPIAPSQGGPGGILIYGGEDLVFYESKDPEDKRESPKRRRMSTSNRRPDATVQWPYSSIAGCGYIDNDRLLLSDQYGKLVLLSLGRNDKKRVKQLTVQLLGESTSAKCIAYLNAGVIFLGSETGDSHLVQVDSAGEIHVVDTFQSVAPISDAVLADLDNSGEPVVVTCSGGGKTGSLRMIRTGANVEELGLITGIDGIKEVFPLSDSDGPHSHLLLSLDRETKLVDARGANHFPEMSERDFPGLLRSQTTITATNISRDNGEITTLAVQITNVAVLLFDVLSGMEHQRWLGNIGVACVKGSFICLGLQGGRVVTLQVDVDKGKLLPRADVQFNQEISAVSIHPGHPNLAIVGFWEEHKVGLYFLETLQPIKGGVAVEMPHVPRSIVVCTFGSGHQTQVYLLVGTGNGQLVTVRLDSKRDSVEISGRRSTSLGDRPVRLCACVVDGRKVVMASGNRTILVSSTKQRITHHHVNIKGLKSAAEFSNDAFPNSLIFNLPTGLVISKIGRLENLKVDSISFGSDIPIIVAYHQEANAFAVGCVRTEPSQTGAPDVVTSSFKLIDAFTYEHLNSYALGTQEEVTKVSVVELTIDGQLGTYIAVGTAIWEDDAVEPSRGRLLLFRTQIGKSRTGGINAPISTVLLSMDEQVPGSVVGIDVVDGKLAVIVNTILIIYAVRRNNITNDLELKALDQWVHSYALWSLVVTNDLDIIVGDSLQSITVLNWGKGRDGRGEKLQYIAQDWSTLNSMNVTADEKTVIQSDIDGNLTSWALETTTEKLQQNGHYFFSENISRLMPASFHNVGRSDRSILTPKHLLFTPGGRISVISMVEDSKAVQLHNIQRNMSAALKQDHHDLLTWRSPRVRNRMSDEPPQAYGFIDGDLLARFLELDLSSPQVKTTLKGTKAAENLGLDYTELRRLIEELQITQ